MASDDVPWWWSFGFVRGINVATGLWNGARAVSFLLEGSAWWLLNVAGATVSFTAALWLNDREYRRRHRRDGQ